VKLVHLVGFIIKKFVTMDGHMNVKLYFSWYRMSLRDIWCRPVRASGTYLA